MSDDDSAEATDSHLLPEANQLFVDATQQEYDRVQHLQSEGVVVMACRPLAYLSVVEMALQMGDTAWGELEAAAADAGAEDVRQFVLAWLCKRGVHLVTSCSPAHAASNHTMLRTITTRRSSLARWSTRVGGGDEYAAAFSLVAE